MEEKSKLGRILLEKRSPISLLPSVRKAIDLITLDPEHPAEIVGSYKYIIHENPVDIDLFENCSYEAASLVPILKHIVELFKDMASRLMVAKDTYLADFKAGEDSRFFCPYMGTYEILKGYKDYDPERVREWIDALGSLLSVEEKKEMLEAVEDHPTYFQYIRLEDLIRSKRVVRWTLRELFKGQKKLAGNLIYTLEEAIQSHTVMKIDIWTWIKNGYVEVTNWFRLRFRQKGTKKWDDLTQPLPLYEESIRKGVRDYFDPRLEKNMKMAKRIWLYAVYKNDYQLMKLLYPLFRSDASRLGQLRGEIEVLHSMLESIEKNPPIRFMIEQMIHFNDVVSTITQDVLPIEEKNRIFRRIEHFYDYEEKEKTLNKEEKQQYLDDFKATLEFIDSKISMYIQRYVYAFLKKKSLFAVIEKIFAIPSPRPNPMHYVLST